MKFNEKLTMLRKQKNLSQESLAEILNVARQTISKWELGETTPEMDKLVQLSKIFNISLDELIKDEIEVVNKDDSNNTNTQKLAGITIKILKGIGIFLLVSIITYLVIVIVSLIAFNGLKINQRVETVVESEEIIVEEQ
ncbi:MAG: helix-turn-helix transcriptional regulator [Clostridia bacterium]|nr:helix-turn-helix transcriptional regulator [Clostridia bacterium]